MMIIIMMTTTTTTLILLALLLQVGIVLHVVHGHVALVYPPGRTNNDYLYTFDGDTCVGNSCDGYCGDPYTTPNAKVTTLPVDTPFQIRWYSPIPHEPYQYRLSLNKQSYDGNFDSIDNILTIVNANDARISTNSNNGNNNDNNNFETTVTIPSDDDALENCNDMNNPCVLQLYDLYYFVSCANVVLTDNINMNEVNNGDPPSTSTTSTSYFDYEEALKDVDYDPSKLIVVTSASFEDYKIMTLPPPEATSDEAEGLLLDPTLELTKCATYTFAMNSPGHPFVLQTKPGIIIDDFDDNGVDTALYYDYQPYPTNNVNVDNNNAVQVDGIEQGIYQFTVPIDAPSILYYQCTLHENMSGIINIIDHNIVDEVGDVKSCEEYLSKMETSSSSSSSSRRSESSSCFVVVTTIAVLYYLL